jgi:hypothetical protein
MSENLEDYYRLPDNEDEIIEDMEYLLLIMKAKKRKNEPIFAAIYLFKKCVDGLEKKINSDK